MMKKESWEHPDAHMGFRLFPLFRCPDLLVEIAEKQITVLYSPPMTQRSIEGLVCSGCGWGRPLPKKKEEQAVIIQSAEIHLFIHGRSQHAKILRLPYSDDLGYNDSHEIDLRAEKSS